MTEIASEERKFWALPLYVAAAEAPTAGYQAIGKVVQGLTFETEELPDWELSDWGYGPGKRKQLERNYWNEDEINRVRAVLKKRSLGKYTSVAVSLRGQPKDARSQGWCMLSLVISRYKDWSSVEVQYRTTELILKFAADVWFLRTVLLPRLGIEDPDVCRFRFANCALSGAYFPYLCNKLDLVQFLHRVHKSDPDFSLRTTRFLLKSSYRKDQYHPFSPERVSHKYWWKNCPRELIHRVRDYLEPLHKATGRPLPKDFHDSSYIPKGQRTRSEEYEE